MIAAFLQLVVFALAVLAAAKFVPGIRVDSVGSALWFAIVFAVLNFLTYWFFFLLSIPFIIVTLGLGYFVVSFIIHAIIFWLSDKFVSGVHVNGFGAALMGALCTSFATWLFSQIAAKRG